MKARIFLFVVLVIFLNAFKANAFVGGVTARLHVEGRYLKDAHGNNVNLHGVAMTPSPWFNGGGSGIWRWNNYDVTGCLNYNYSVMDALTDTTRGWYLNYVRLHIDPYWTNNPGMPTTGENDISQFNFERLKTTITDVIVPLISHAKSRGMYIILRPPGVCPEKIAVGDAYQKYLLKVWGYLSNQPDLKNADNVMFELANEPVQILGADGTYGSGSQGYFDQLKLFFQPIVDTIRTNGARNILWIPGLGYQSQYKGYAINPIEGDNIGYSVHIYPGFLNGGPDYDAFQKGWDDNVKPVADFAPIAITEVDWSPQVGVDANGKSYNMGTWGTGTTGTAAAPGFGYNFKRIVNNSGNVSWNLLAPEGLIDKGNSDGGVAFDNNPDACANACYTWFKDYSKVNFARPDFAYQSHSDNGDGTFTNPLISADFPDPDVIRVGDMYYMVSTTMHVFPGATILKSHDLVNWEYCSNPLDKIETTNCYNLDGCNRYGRGQWASSLKYNKGTYYLHFNTLDEGSYLLTATDPEGPWVKKKLSSSFYDAGLFFDDNGKVYIVYGINKLRIAELDANFNVVNDKEITYGSIQPGLDNSATEGSHMYKINGYYYIYATTGGYYATQVAYRSSSVFGPYDEKEVFNSDRIHQGALIQTQTGEWWTMLFADKGAYGRMPMLEPVTWTDNWPVIGVSGKGVTTYKKPNVGQEYPITTLPTNDNFRSYKLGLQWGWNHNPDNSKWSLTERPDYLRLKTVNVVDSLVRAKNTLTQRIVGYPTDLTHSYGTIKLSIKNMLEGDVAGLAVFQDPYAYIGVKVMNGQKKLIVVNNNAEVIGQAVTDSVIYLRAIANYNTSSAGFYYSFDNKTYTKLGTDLDMKFNLTVFTGNKFCIFNFPTIQTGGYVDVDWFSTESDFTQDKFYDNSFVGYSADALTLTDLVIDNKDITLLTGSTASLTVKALYADGHNEDVSIGATYDNPHPEIVQIINGQVVAKTDGSVMVTVSYKGALGDRKSVNLQLTSSTFPLTSTVLNPSIWEKGTFDETTHTLVTGQYGFGGWQYGNGINLSNYKYLVAKLVADNTSSVSFRIFDENSYWTTPAQFDFGSNRQVVVNLSNAYKNGTTTKLNPGHIYIVGFWSLGNKPIVIENVYLTNNDDYTPTAIDEVWNDDINELVDVYTIMGIRIRSQIKRELAVRGLTNGLYIVGKKKVLIVGGCLK
jgi:beta-xylosidase